MNCRLKIKLAPILSCICLITLALTRSRTDQPTLRNTFEDYFNIGTALNYDQIMGVDTASIALIKKQFNSITPENILKWEFVNPEQGKYNFNPVDSFVAFGEKNKMEMIGHTLVWDNQTPDWVFQDDSGNPATRDILLQRMKDHIFAVVGRYKGQINGWDVVNEALDDNGELRQSRWLGIIGEDYIQKAFEWAHQADPDAELYYNDFNLWVSEKREGAIRLIRDLQAKGVPIDGIGMQGHWGLDYPTLDELNKSIQAYAELGIDIMVTELDMDILPRPDSYTGADITRDVELKEELNPWPDMLPDSMQLILANRYSEIFKILNEHHHKISRVTFWGVHDGLSWRNNWPIRGRSAYPLLFDNECQPKAAFNAVIQTAGGDK